MLLLTLALTIAAGAQTAAPAAAAPTVNDVAWITGCWESTRNGRHVTEHWLAPEGGTMMGISRTTAGEKTTEWEFLIIRRGPRGLDYVAKPSGQPEGTFTATSASATEVVFENLAHDFPKRIIYKRTGDALTASIEGPMNGQNRRIDFAHKKAACAGS